MFCFSYCAVLQCVSASGINIKYLHLHFDTDREFYRFICIYSAQESQTCEIKFILHFLLQENVQHLIGNMNIHP